MPKTTAVAVGLAFFMVLSFQVPAGAEGMIKMDISAVCDMIFGETAYEIGDVVTMPDRAFKTHFPISRLEFPLNIQMLTLRADITAARRLQFRAGWSRNLTSDPGRMIDYDWFSPGSLTIYSESMLDMEAEVLSANLRFTLLSVNLDRYSSLFEQGDQWDMFAGLGYRHQKFNYSASDTRQFYPGVSNHEDYGFSARAAPEASTLAMGPGHYFPGPTLIYAVKYSLPYLEIGFRLNQGRAAAEVSLGYSPFARAEDEDHHLLRDMRSNGDCDGDAFLVSFFYRYFWTTRWFSSLHLNYTIIETGGTSRTFVNDTWSHTIDQEISSEQTWVGLDIGWAF